MAVFAAMAAIVTTQGLGVLWVYGKFMGQFYLGIVLLWGLIALAGGLLAAGAALASRRRRDESRV